MSKLSWLILVIMLTACDFGSGGNNPPNSETPETPTDPGDPSDPDPVIPTKPVANQELKLHPASNCDDLKTYIAESLINQYASIPKHIHYFYCPVPAVPGADSGAEPVPAPATGDGAAASDSSSAPDDVSDTNNQEVGVNEADVIKADAAGNIFLVTGRHFIVARGFPPTEMNELARIDLGGRGLNLFLDENNQRVTVMARHDVATPAVLIPEGLDTTSVIYPYPQSDYTVALFYDVSNPAEPALIKQLRLQGYYREGRRMSDRLHLVSNHHLRPMNLFNDEQFSSAYQAFNNAVYQARCNNPDGDIATDPLVIETRNNLISVINAIVSVTDPVDYLPKAFEMVDGAPVETPYLACSDVNYPDITLSLGLQIVSSIDTDGENLDATAIVNNSYITYVSQDHLYLAENSYSWWWLLPDGSWPTSQTAIYKFSISGQAPQYVSTGRVDGYVHNQFSFSEHNGNLRVATTQDDMVELDENQWQRVLSNNVYVLSDSGTEDLEVTGEVRGFGAEENIRSARFYGDRGFVVTFRNIDPLFTFDLSDPANPSLEGELEMPGFSSYIHQYDENTLLTIGRSGGPNGVGVGNGLQLQLIDVSDMSNPVVAHSLVPDFPGGWSSSSAEYDHKAFTFYKPANLLAIPLQIYPQDSTDYFSGIIAFNINLETGFEEVGRVDHKDLAYEYYCGPDSMLVPEYMYDCTNGMYMNWAAPRRSLVMTGNGNVYLYTMSDVGLKASSTAQLENTLGQMIFPVQPYPWWYFGYYPVGVADPFPMGVGAPQTVMF